MKADLEKDTTLKKMFKILLLVILVFVLNTIVAGQISTEMLSYTRGITNPIISPSGTHVVFSGEDYQGLYLLDLVSEKTLTIVKNPGAGYGANFSANGNKIGFKQIDKNGLQQPAYYDVTNQKIVTLFEKSIAAGVTTFSKNGRIAFTVGKSVIVLNEKLTEIYRYDLNNYANLAPISPDARKIVYNDANDQLFILDLETGDKTQLTFGDQSYFNPIWSHDSKKVAFSSINGFVFTIDIEGKNLFEIGRGSSVCWLENNNRVIYCEQKWNEKYQLISSLLTATKYNGEDKQLITNSGDGLIRFAKYSPKSHKIVYVEKNQIFIGEVKTNTLRIVSSKTIQIKSDQFAESMKKVKSGQSQLTDNMEIKLFSAPYLHQVYDTPNWFNGHWACGATSAMMALAYYDILPAWPCNCQAPYFHESKYGNYICETYIFNGYTYNIGGLDPNNTLSYGGYGFIINNNWADTKGYMAKYVRQHGLGSTVDWSPGYSEFQREINEEFPVVILNSLTSSGHYILGVGYNSTQKTVFVNDPYGNKNDGYMNYNGKRVIYDWPGYNSGHSNLNIVHCLIYMRIAPDLSIAPFLIADTLSTCEKVPFTLTISNIGGKDSDSSSVTLYLSSNSFFTEDDYLLKTVPVPVIAVNDSINLEVSVELPDSLPSKKWAIGARVDDNNDLLENSKANNLVYSVFTLKGYPELYGFKPSPDQEVNTTRPEISVRFKDDYFGIILDSTKLFLNGHEITESCEIQTSKIKFIPQHDLSPGRFVVSVEVQNNLGNVTSKKWQYNIVTTHVQDKNNRIDAAQFALSQNYPNPFNSSTQISYRVSDPGPVTMTVYSIDGRFIRTLVNTYQTPGTYFCFWNGKDELNSQVSSGIYLYKLISKNYVKTHRMIYLK
jgi:Tol biopolymer transport system component